MKSPDADIEKLVGDLVSTNNRLATQLSVQDPSNTQLWYENLKKVSLSKKNYQGKNWALPQNKGHAKMHELAIALTACLKNAQHLSDSTELSSRKYSCELLFVDLCDINFGIRPVYYNRTGIQGIKPLAHCHYADLINKRINLGEQYKTEEAAPAKQEKIKQELAETEQEIANTKFYKNKDEGCKDYLQPGALPFD
jgi:hypothetical protein